METKLKGPSDSTHRIFSLTVNRLRRKLEYLSSTQDLSKIMWTIKGFIDNDVYIIYKARGGVLTLDPKLPLLIVSDSHGLRRLFLEFLFARKYMEGKTNLDLLLQGKIQILMLGDALHTENRSLWTNTLIDEYMKNYVHHRFYGDMPGLEKEMANGFGLVSVIMSLLRISPHFHYLKGNHDNIRNTTVDGNDKVVKFLDNPDHGEGAILKAGLESWLVKRSLKKEGIKSWEAFLDEYTELDERLRWGAYTSEDYYKIYQEWKDDLEYLKGRAGWILYNEFLAKYVQWENRLPVVAIYEGASRKIAISHSPPGDLPIRDMEEIRNRSDKVVFNFTWPNDSDARKGEYVPSILNTLFPDGGSENRRNTLYIAGHVHTDEGVEMVVEKGLVMINKPGSLVVLTVYPEREFFGVDVISSSENYEEDHRQGDIP